jgi:hypothetical protein
MYKKQDTSQLAWLDQKPKREEMSTSISAV